MPARESDFTQRRTLISLVCFYFNTFATLLVANMFVYTQVILSRSMTGSDGFTGLVFVANYLPTLVFGVFAGALLDRVSRLAVIYVAQSVYIVTAFLLAAIIHAGWLSFETRWILVAISAVNGAALTFIIPGRLSLLANLVPEGSAGRATIILNVLIILGFGLAPLVTGVFKQHLDWAPLMAVIGGFYLIAWAALFPVRPRDYERRAPAGAIDSFIEGLRFAASQPLVRQLLLFEMMVMAVIGPIQVLMPEFARSTLELDEAGRGAFLSALGGGLFLGGVAARVFQERKRRGLLMLVCAILMGFVLSLIAFQPIAWIAALKLGVCGVFGGVLGALIPAALQGATPDYMRGRVMGLYGMIFQLLPGLAGFASGLGADAAGLLNMLTLTGLGLTALGLGGLVGLGHLRRFQ